MHGSAQHHLNNLQVTPPPEAWEHIASQLPAGTDALEMQLSQKLYNYEVLPPADIWQSINVALGPPRPASVIPFRKITIAAAVAAAIAGITWITFNYNNSDSSTSATVSATPVTNTPVAPTAVTPGALAAIPATGPRNIVQHAVNSISRATDTEHAFFVDEPANISYAGLNVQPAVVSNNTAEVEAPPIRDSNGNIILDQQFLTKGNNDYVTVTGPNGEQTRISARFLRMLTNFSNDDEPGSSLEDIIWKNRFREWRNKLRQQISFIPSATNFLDIVELKNILQENQ